MITKNRILCLILLLSIAYKSNAQRILSGNLVINSGFEQYTQCPDNFTQINYAYPWSDCFGGGGSSDFLHKCSTAINIQTYLSYQYPRTGDGETAILMYGSWTGHNYREYLLGMLNDSLRKQKRYCGEFYTSLFNYSKGAVENVGMYFSVDTSFTFDTVYNAGGLFSLNPQIEYHNGIIMDTVNWVKVNGSFIASGNEKYLVIGNFRDNIHTNYLEVSYGVISPYYYIDDVSVCECSFEINLGEDTKFCGNETMLLNATLPNATYTWQDGSHAATYEVKQPGTYWVNAYVADYDITSTDTIVIAAEDDTYCNPPLTIPNFITPNNDNVNDNFRIGNADKYDISLQIYNRWGTLIYQTAHYTNDYNCHGCADGVYYYLLTAKSLRSGKVKDYKGSLTVIN